MPRKKKIIVNTPQKEKYVPKEEEFVPKEEDSLKQFGQKIREARIAKNLSLESVSGHLHIPVKILEAIEEGDAEKCPKPVFLRGLVRTYCHYLGIDKNDVVDKIEKHLNLENKYTESDLSFFLRKPRSTKQTIDELIEKAKLSADNMNDEEKIEKFKNLFVENIKLKRKIRVLEEKLFKHKFELGNIDLNE